MTRATVSDIQHAGDRDAAPARMAAATRAPHSRYSRNWPKADP